MTAVDIIVIFVIVLSALFGILRGFVREAISLAKWILATWVAATFAGKFANMLPLESEAAAQATAFGILFILVFIVGAMVSFVVSTFVKKTGLSGADRVFGFAFGVLRGAVIVLVFVVVGQTVTLTQTQWWQDSTMLERFERVAIELQDYIPTMQAPSVDTDKLVDEAASGIIENVDPEEIMEQLKP